MLLLRVDEVSWKEYCGLRLQTVQLKAAVVEAPAAASVNLFQQRCKIELQAEERNASLIEILKGRKMLQNALFHGTNAICGFACNLLFLYQVNFVLNVP